MKKISFFPVILLFLPMFVKAQLIPIQYDTLDLSHEIIFSGGLDFSGSALQNEFTSKFIRGGVITSDLKGSSFDRHKGINRFGGILNGGIEYRSYNTKLFKKKDWGIVAKAGTHIFAGMIYSQDVFGLMFYGNERYLGDTISMSGISANMTMFQKVGFGLIDRKSKSNLTINFYNLNNRLSTNFRDLEIIQSSSGDEIQIVMDGDVQVRESSKFTQGLGLGFDADFKLPIAWGKDQAYIQFQANNVGVAYMLEPQRVYSIDTTITYTGFEFDQLIGDDAIVLDSVDILDTLGINSSLRYRTILLPGFVQIGKIVDEHSLKRIQTFFGMRLYPTLIYSPYVFGGVDAKATNWLRVGANLGYGGFTNFRAGLYANLQLEKLSLGLATENIIGAISKVGNGQSLYFRVRCAF